MEDLMKCPKCQFDNPEAMKFCGKCGSKIERICPKCGFANPPAFKFCGECGHQLEEPTPPEEEKPFCNPKGERKYVTVLFSDLSGYTAMSERLDPEDVKEVTTRIFGVAAKIIDKYEGFVEKYAGDAVMALFGVPDAHEDDPVRAIRAAREIHGLVENISPGVEELIGRPLTMHTGVNTGLVVTGEVDMEKGTHGVAGDAINVAARLSSLAEADGILVGRKTFQQAEGYFEFEQMDPVKVKGREEAVQTYKVVSLREKPVTLHRLTGLRADLVGRKVEMARLKEALDELYAGKGTIFSIYGDAGTGKSRLIEEFKNSLDPETVQWLEGHAYAYAQNIPYFPVINLLSRTFQVNEGDPPEKIREKIETGVHDLTGGDAGVVPYVGSLFSLSYPEVDDVSPEFWKARLKESIQVILSSLVQRSPTVILLEDLHWADPSSIELFRAILTEFRHPALLLCLYRPQFSLFSSHQSASLGEIYHEISLQDLSPTESQEMVQSLLKTGIIPKELERFLQRKVEGNPFYLEEVVNALIDSGVLRKDNGTWQVTAEIKESEISSTINGVITARLDRLERETRRVLQEASVIGRSFLYDILTRSSELKEQCDRHLLGLERLDLIRAKTLEPDLEYIFKHALTQEIVYNGLLKKERQKIHERIGLVMEQLFQDRLPEFYETLAYHFKNGESDLKAVDYLTKSGEKALKRYAVQEAHQYYEEAFSLLTSKPIETEAENKRITELLIKWSLVYYYRGDFIGMVERLKAYKDQADLLEDKEIKGMFYAWLGFSFWFRGRFKETYEYSNLALRLGQDVGNKKVIGYACTFLSFACCELGDFDQAISDGQKANDIGKELGSDHYLFFKPLFSVATVYFYMGEVDKNHQLAQRLLDYGKRHSNIRCLVVGHLVKGFAHVTAGHYSAAIECFNKALEVSADPFYSYLPRGCLGFCYVQTGELGKAEEVLRLVYDYSKNFGCEFWGDVSRLFLGIVEISKGEMSEGLKTIKNAHDLFCLQDRKYFIATTEFILASIYSQIILGEGEITPGTMIKNLGFLVKNVPFAGKKAEQHFHNAIDVAKEIGAKGVMGQAYLGLGHLHKGKKRIDRAKECMIHAVQLFEECNADAFLKQAEEALASLQ
jgi:class 3 adenylate cyclase/tetratricopeptide (TPR) repeat protein